jgi:hypothetical protein
LDDEGQAVAEPSSAVVEFATTVVVDVDDDAVAVAAAGRAVGADTRLGIRLGDGEDKWFWGEGDKGRREMRASVGWARRRRRYW